MAFLSFENAVWFGPELDLHPDVLYVGTHRHFLLNRVQECITFDPPGPTLPGEDGKVSKQAPQFTLLVSPMAQRNYNFTTLKYVILLSK